MNESGQRPPQFLQQTSASLPSPKQPRTCASPFLSRPDAILPGFPPRPLQSLFLVPFNYSSSPLHMTEVASHKLACVVTHNIDTEKGQLVSPLFQLSRVATSTLNKEPKLETEKFQRDTLQYFLLPKIRRWQACRCVMCESACVCVCRGAQPSVCFRVLSKRSRYL